MNLHQNFGILKNFEIFDQSSALKSGRPALTYIDILKKDTGLDPGSNKTAMQDRGVWKAIVDQEHYPP